MKWHSCVAVEQSSGPTRTRAFWEDPDWSGGDNIRSGAEPFWMRDPLPPPKPPSVLYAVPRHVPQTLILNPRTGEAHLTGFGLGEGLPRYLVIDPL